MASAGGRRAKDRSFGGELVSLKLADNRHAIAILFRVFLELSVDHYFDEAGLVTHVTKNGHRHDKNLKGKVKEAIDHMVAGGTDRKVLEGAARAMDDSNNPLNPETLNNYVHNRFYSPKESDLTVAWDNARAFLGQIWPT